MNLIEKSLGKKSRYVTAIFFLITKINLFKGINSRPLMKSVQIDQILIINLGNEAF